MQADYHQIRPRPAAARCKRGMKPQMSSMGFVHDQRYAMAVYDPRDLLHIRDPSLISGRDDQHTVDIRLPLQSFPHLLRRNSLTDSHIRHLFRIQIGEMELPQISCVIYGLVAIAGNQQPAALWNGSADGTQYPAGASPHKIISLLRSIGGSRALL